MLARPTYARGHIFALDYGFVPTTVPSRWRPQYLNIIPADQAPSPTTREHGRESHPAALADDIPRLSWGDF